MFVSAKCRARGWNLVQLGLDVINGSLDVVVFLDNHRRSLNEVVPAKITVEIRSCIFKLD